MIAVLCPGKARRKTKKDSKGKERAKNIIPFLDPMFILLHGWSRVGVNNESKGEEKRVREPNLLPFVVKSGIRLLCKLNFLALFYSRTHRGK